MEPNATKRVRVRVSKTSLTARYVSLLSFSSSLMPLARYSNLYMMEYLATTPDTTVDEFAQVWRTLAPEIKDVRHMRFNPLPLLTLQ